MNIAHTRKNALAHLLQNHLFLLSGEKVNDNPNKADYSSLVSHSTFLGIYPLLFYVSSQTKNSDAFPDTMSRNRCQQAYYATHLSYQRFFMLWEKCSYLLRSHAIPHIPLKGIVLAQNLYNNPGLRPFSDIDLLIQKKDLERTIQLLSAHNYSLYPGPLPTRMTRTFLSELQFVLSYSRERGPLFHEIHWDFNFLIPSSPNIISTMFSRAVPSYNQQEPFTLFTNEDMLISLILHLARHIRQLNILHLYDIALLCQKHGDEIDADLFHTLIADNNWRNITYLCASIITVIFPVPFLTHCAKGLANVLSARTHSDLNKLAIKIANAILEAKPLSFLEESHARILMLDTPYDRIRYFYSTAIRQTAKLLWKPIRNKN